MRSCCHHMECWSQRVNRVRNSFIKLKLKIHWTKAFNSRYTDQDRILTTPMPFSMCSNSHRLLAWWYTQKYRQSFIDKNFVSSPGGDRSEVLLLSWNPSTSVDLFKATNGASLDYLTHHTYVFDCMKRWKKELTDNKGLSPKDYGASVQHNRWLPPGRRYCWLRATFVEPLERLLFVILWFWKMVILLCVCMFVVNRVL